eukprot:m.58645 g.58645  ORF g.58645 m.58645 type:complete len:838 (+) comp7874_c0_seq1:69-2582(+)
MSSRYEDSRGRSSSSRYSGGRRRYDNHSDGERDDRKRRKDRYEDDDRDDKIYKDRENSSISKEHKKSSSKKSSKSRRRHSSYSRSRSRSKSPSRSRSRSRSRSPAYRQKFREIKDSKHRLRKEDKMRLKMMETPEEKRARRLAKRELKAQHRRERMGIDAGGDDLFVWNKKTAEAKGHGLDRDDMRSRERNIQEENMRELEIMKRQRQEREQQREMAEKEKELRIRAQDEAQFGDWSSKEEEFLMQQAKVRSELRMKNGRAKPVDVFAKYIHEKDEELAVQGLPPFTVFKTMTIKSCEDLVEDIDVFIRLEGADEQAKRIWKDILTICNHMLNQRRREAALANPNLSAAEKRALDTGINDAVKESILGILQGKTLKELEDLRHQIELTLSSPDTIDTTYWETLLHELKVQVAKSRLLQIHEERLQRKLTLVSNEFNEEAKRAIVQAKFNTINKSAADIKVKEKQREERKRRKERKKKKQKQEEIDARRRRAMQKKLRKARTAGITLTTDDLNDLEDEELLLLEEESDDSDAERERYTKEKTIQFTLDKEEETGKKESIADKAHISLVNDDDETEAEDNNDDDDVTSSDDEGDDEDVDRPISPIPEKIVDEMEVHELMTQQQLNQDLHSMKFLVTLMTKNGRNGQLHVNFCQYRNTPDLTEAAKEAEFLAHAEKSSMLAEAEEEGEDESMPEALNEEVDVNKETEVETAEGTVRLQYRARKPRYLNRVFTGFDWNEYNRTHYDKDNPPPRLVLGYKFNIHYSDLIDRTQTPIFTVMRIPEEPGFSIIRFHSGPPYEDVAFKIVDEQWNYGRRSGYRCQFTHKNVFELYFRLSRRRYRR